MKKYLFCLLALLCTTFTFAETQYKVVEVVGRVNKFEGKKVVQLKKGDVINESTVVMVTYKASLKVENTSGNGIFIVGKVGKGQLKNLLTKQKDVVDSSKEYFDYVNKQINGNANIHKVQSDPATVTREADSVKVDTIVNKQ